LWRGQDDKASATPQQRADSAGILTESGGRAVSTEPTAREHLDQAGALAVDAGGTLQPGPMQLEVVATYRGKPVVGVPLRIGDATRAAPFVTALPNGVTTIHVDEGDYRGQYSCTVAEGAATCAVTLEKRKRSRRGRRGQGRDKEDGELLHMFKPGEN